MNMSNSLVRELFRNLQTSIQERLSVLEELIGRSAEPEDKPQAHGTIEQSLHITRVDPALQERLNAMDTTLRELFNIQKTLAESVKESKARDKETQSMFWTFNDCIKDTDCRVVQALDQLEKINRHFLSLEARMKVLEARVTVAEPAVEEVQDDIVKEEEEDAPVIAEAEAADVDEDEEEGGQEEDADEDEEEGGLEGEEFTYKGDTYFRDTTNKVYIPDEDGAVDPDSPVGLWVPNPKLKEGGKITRLT